mmetsp:Transcript_91678/g.159010  ORF Transcript_91678/g.159010 Transcript_91678/m.159010 type:complete len:1238 (+) Transcript_91678:122-3835(+)
MMCSFRLVVLISPAIAQTIVENPDGYPGFDNPQFGGNHYIKHFGNEPTICRDHHGNITTCKKVPFLWLNFMAHKANAPPHIGFPQFSSLMRFAQRVNQEQKMLPGYEIVIHPRDSSWNQQVVTEVMYQEVVRTPEKYVGLLGVGDGGSIGEIVRYGAGEFRLPLFSATISQSVFTEPRSRHPMIGSYTHSGQAWNPFYKMAVHMGWKSVAVVYDPRQFEYEGKYFTNQLEDNGFKVPFSKPLQSILALPGIIEDLQRTRARVVYIWAESEAFIWLACELYKRNMGGIITLHFVSNPWFMSASLFAQDEQCKNPSNLMEAAMYGIGFAPVISDFQNMGKKLTCLPDATIGDLVGELMQFMGGALASVGNPFPPVPSFPGGADVLCMAVLYVKHMLENGYSLEDLMDKGPKLYEDFLNWELPTFTGMAGETSYPLRKRADGSTYRDEKNVYVDITQITGTDFMRMPSMGASPPFHFGSLTYYEEHEGGTVIEKFLHELQFENGTVPNDTFPDCPFGAALIKGLCTACPPGTKLVRKAGMTWGECVACEPGFEQPLPGQEHCDVCPLGTFSNTSGQEKCDPCGKGTSRGAGLSPTQCETCPAGSYSSTQGLSECEHCGVGNFSNLVGSSQCTSCLDGMTTRQIASRSATDCVCKSGTYMNKEAAVCEDCPKGAECKGPFESPNAMVTDDGNHRPPQVLEGYMSMGTSVYKCGGDGQACPGSFMFAPVDEMCAHGGEGRACAECPSGRFWNDHYCSECEGGSWLGVVACPIALFLIAGLFIFYWNEKSAKVEAVESVLASVTIGVTINFMQSVGVFSRLDFAWPIDVTAIMDFVKLFVFDMSILRFGCVFKESLAMKVVSSLLLPIGVCAVFLAWYPTSWLINRLTKGWFRGFNIDALLNALGMILQAFYISMVLSVVSGVDCYRSPNDELTLRVSPSNLCWEGEHIPIAIASAIGGVVYVIGFCAGLSWVIVKAPVKIVDPSFALRFKFVFFKYAPTTWWFALPMMLRSVMIALVTVVSPNDGYMQFLLMLFILVSFGFWHLLCMPYSDRYANNLETVELGFLIIILGFGSWFLTDKSGRSNADDDPDQAQILSAVLVLFLVVCILTVAVVFVYAMYIAYNPEKVERRFRNKLEALLPSLRLAAKVVQETDNEHLIEDLLQATYRDIRALVATVDYITVEIGGEKVNAYKRHRLPRSSSRLSVTDNENEKQSSATDSATGTTDTKSNKKIAVDEVDTTFV